MSNSSADSSSTESKLYALHFRRVRNRMTALIKCKKSPDEFSHMALMTKKQESRDWLFISIITLAVSCLDKVFDLLFILELAERKEWSFMAISLFFTLTSTTLTSLFAAQSFWVQSSSIPVWSSDWLEKAQKKRKAFLENFLYRPINRRIVPHDSAFKVKPSIDNKGASRNIPVSAWGNVETVFTITDVLHSNDELVASKKSSRDRCKEHCTIPCGHSPQSNENNAFDNSLVKESSVSMASESSFTKSVSQHSEGSETTASAGDTTEVPPSEMQEVQFRPWVRYMLGAIFCTGLLPEWVLVVNLSMYAGAGEDRVLIGQLLRDTWFVQTIKLSEALLESIPQIHIKIFYFLTTKSWSISQVFGLGVNATSIGIGLISALHVQIPYKVVGFVFIFSNLVARMSVSAALNQATTNGVYFATFACALTISAAVTAFKTLVHRGNYRRYLSPLEKYVGEPIFRTFCMPPEDASGLLVSGVFVVAGVVFCVVYDGEDRVLLSSMVVCVAVFGQGLAGLAWYIVGISELNYENKKKTSMMPHTSISIGHSTKQQD
ncbi:uncharacterized protein LOC108674113 [Hyalella azteca]|uniref:Uncharacterized protein LOC108674113 n=1 Tax=Hyalella azteca TaxID=294128 RepID=A0A8B7NUU1_HYAAZ|nr:uncharacterized protein LOC108674113 [Hyalella azteca]